MSVKKYVNKNKLFLLYWNEINAVVVRNNHLSITKPFLYIFSFGFKYSESSQTQLFVEPTYASNTKFIQKPSVRILASLPLLNAFWKYGYQLVGTVVETLELQNRNTKAFSLQWNSYHYTTVYYKIITLLLDITPSIH